MKRTAFWIVCLVLLWNIAHSPCVADAAEVCIARDGKALATIVLPQETELTRFLNPSEAEIEALLKQRLPKGSPEQIQKARGELPKYRQAEARRVGDEELLAAEELIEFVKKMSTATLPLHRLAKNEALPQGPVILLGAELARAEGFGNEIDSLKPDSILLRIKGDKIILSGCRARGALYAVYELLESLGCRWLMPGPFGEVIPNLPEVVINVDKIENPSHVWRYWWCTHGAGKDYARWTLRNKGNFLPALGDQLVAQGHALSGPLRWGAAGERGVKTKQTLKQPKLDAAGKPLKDAEGNPVLEEVEKEITRLPDEYYAMRGTALNMHTPNMSNPKVWDLYADYHITSFYNRPFGDYASISAEDGLVTDDRAESRALDSFEFDRFLGAMSATDRLWFFHSRYIDRVLAELPGRRFGVLVYSNNTMPPRLSSVHPAMSLIFAPLSICPLHHVRDEKCKTNREYRKWLESWMAQAKAAGAQTFYYDYIPIGFQWNTAMLSPQWAIIGRNYPWFHELGLDGHTTQGFDDWGSSHLSNWAAIRLYWNARQSYRDIINDYCRIRFGKAGPAMNDYYTVFERRMDEIPDLCSNEIWGNHLVLTPEVRADARKALNKAVALAESEFVKRQLEAMVVFQSGMDAFCDAIELARETGDFGAAAKKIEPAFEAQAKLNAIYSHFVNPSQFSRGQKTRYTAGGWQSKYLDFDHKIKGSSAYIMLPRFMKLALDTDNLACARQWQRPETSVAALEDGDTTVPPDVKYQTQRETAAFFYRTEIKIPETFAGCKRVTLYFPSLIARAMQIWINGEPVKFDHGSYSDTVWQGPLYFWENYDHQREFDVSGLVKPGANNTIAFRVFKSFDHAGSYDRIFLLADSPAN